MPANIPMMPEDELPTEDLSAIWERMLRQQQRVGSQPASRGPSYDPWSDDTVFGGSYIPPKPIQYPIGAKSELKWSVQQGANSQLTLRLGRYGSETRELAVASCLESYKADRASNLREVNHTMDNIARINKRITEVTSLLATELARASELSNNASLPNA